MHDFAEINARLFHLKVRLLLRRCVYFFKLHMAFHGGDAPGKKGANVSEGKPEVGTDINICRGLIGFGSTTIP